MNKIILFVLFAVLILSCKKKEPTKNDTTSQKADTQVNISGEKSAYQRLVERQGVYESYKLKNGYQVIFECNDSFQYLLLKKGEQIIDTINGTFSIGLPYSYLGYVKNDFDNSFIIIQGFGSGNPHPIQLFDKKSGKKLIDGYYMAVDTMKQMILHSKNGVPDEKDKMYLYDVNTNTEKSYNFPKDIFKGAEILNRTESVKIIDNKHFKIEYYIGDTNELKTKVYKR